MKHNIPVYRMWNALERIGVCLIVGGLAVLFVNVDSSLEADFAARVGMLWPFAEFRSWIFNEKTKRRKPMEVSQRRWVPGTESD